MRVALISYHTSPLASLGSSAAGGMNLYIRRLAEGLAARDVEVDVFTRRDSNDMPSELEFAPGARLMTVRAGPAKVLPKTELAAHAATFAQELCRFDSRNNPQYDVIHSHYWLSGLAAQALRSDSQPVVHMFHTLSRVKRLYQPDSGVNDSPSREYAELSLLKSGHTMVFSTEAEIDDVERAYGFRPRHLALIPPGVDADRFTPCDSQSARAELGLSGQKVILCVGRMDPAKGVDLLLRAGAKLVQSDPDRQFKIVIVGGDDHHRDMMANREVSRLQAITRDLALDKHVEFRGVVPQEQLAIYYSACDVCVVPSRYESFGMVALEAMSSGRPVVGFRSRGLEQTVRDEQTGFLVPSGDTDALAAALGRVLDDGLLARRMGFEARRSIRSFGWDHVTDRSLALYSQLLRCTCGALATGSS